MQNLLKNGHIFIKNVHLKINFQDDGHLDDNLLIYIVTVYSECILLQLFSRGMRIQFCHPNRGSKWTHYLPKNNHMFFLKLIFKMKVICMPTVCFIFSPFALNAYSFRPLHVAYVCTFPSKLVFKTDTLLAKKVVIFCKKNVHLKLNFEHKGDSYANFLFICWIYAVNAVFLSSYLVAYVCTFTS